MTELACKEVIFHFNKAHLKDESIPPWALKTKGKTFYVNHVNCTLPWSTKETPMSSHTKGSIKVKNALLTIDDINHATLSRLTLQDEQRLNHQTEHLRIGWTYQNHSTVVGLLRDLDIQHSKIVGVSSGCSTHYFVCDIYNREDLVQLKLSVGDGFRQFASNEWQYKDYEAEYNQDLDDQVI